MSEIIQEEGGKSFHKKIITTTTESSSLSGSPSRHITVIDVYDLASEIGKDFEKLADQYGTDAVTSIMPKVISALETLESMAKKNSEESEEIMTLKNTIHILENEKRLRLKERNSFEAELEQIEDNYKKEINELKGIVKGLQGENRKLNKKINENSLNNSDNDSSVDENLTSREDDLNLIMSLKEEISSQKDRIKEINNENESYENEICTLQSYIEKLISQNQELIRKNDSLGTQARGLIGEKNEILKALQKLEIANFEIRKQLNETEKACQDLESLKKNNSSSLTNNEDAPRFTLRELREVLQEKNTLKARVMELEETLEEAQKCIKVYKENERKNHSGEGSNFIERMNYHYNLNRDSSRDSISTLSFDIMPESSVSLNNTSIPMPTTDSSLGPEVVGYEEHVNNSYNSIGNNLSNNSFITSTGRKNTGKSIDTHKITSFSKKLTEEGIEEAIEFCANQMSDEMIVYGPINKEPEDKLTPWNYERKESNIKKFFKFFKYTGSGLSARSTGSTSNASNVANEE
uniref:RILP-like protein homolog n=1 Tax=Parastrongyloides trichosuri TaxID=131310 RepID=A0A0N5A4U6_PARTI